MGHQNDLSRFMSKVRKEGECWVWTARKTPPGYGKFWFKGKDRYAHRVSLELFGGNAPPDDKLVMHSCDNPSCVNPDHLSIGTQFDNMQDAAGKGRCVRVGDWNGQKNPKAKLSPDDIASIHAMLDAGVGPTEIGKKYGVSRIRIQQIKRQRKGV